MVSYSPQGLRVPVDGGDLWEGMNDNRNMLLRDLPASWTRVDLSMSFAPTGDYQHAGVVLYGSDDDYLELTRVHNGYSGGHAVAMINEVGAVAGAVPRVSTSASELLLRLDRSPVSGEVVGSFSADAGATWVEVGRMTRSIADARIALNATGSAGGSPVATFHRLTITTAGD